MKTPTNTIRSISTQLVYDFLEHAKVTKHFPLQVKYNEFKIHTTQHSKTDDEAKEFLAKFLNDKVVLPYWEEFLTDFVTGSANLDEIATEARDEEFHEYVS